MIFDTLSNIACYKGIHSSLDLAIAYLKSHSLSDIPLGTRIVSQEWVKLTAMQADLQEPKNAIWEYHQRFVDIHICLEGTEAFGYLPKEEVEDWLPYEEEKDCAISHSQQVGVVLPISSSRFVVCFPGDGHRPLMQDQGTGQVRKIIVKVSV